MLFPGFSNFQKVIALGVVLVLIVLLLLIPNDDVQDNSALPTGTAETYISTVAAPVNNLFATPLPPVVAPYGDYGK